MPGIRTIPGTFLVLLLMLLLIGTTPIGTGSGVHQSTLLHPLFEHVHVVNGRVLSHEQLEAQAAQADQAEQSRGLDEYRRGLAIGADAGAAAADAGLGLSPTIPVQLLDLVLGVSLGQVPLQARPPQGRVEAPPDPPPTSAA